MSVWQKTLLYLGLVDEDELAAETSAKGGQSTTPMPSQSSPQRLSVNSSTTPQNPAGSGPPPGAAQPRIRPADAGRGPRRVEPPDPARRRSSSSFGRSVAGVTLRPGEYGDTAVGHAEIIAAHSFGDAKRLADMIRERIPVLVNLRDTEPEMVRRLVDFSSGLIYALDGTMRKVSEGVILVSPPRVVLSPEEERRLADLGLYDST